MKFEDMALWVLNPEERSERPIKDRRRFWAGVALVMVAIIVLATYDSVIYGSPGSLIGTAWLNPYWLWRFIAAASVGAVGTYLVASAIDD